MPHFLRVREARGIRDSRSLEPLISLVLQLAFVDAYVMDDVLGADSGNHHAVLREHRSDLAGARIEQTKRILAGPEPKLVLDKLHVLRDKADLFPVVGILGLRLRLAQSSLDGLRPHDVQQRVAAEPNATLLAEHRRGFLVALLLLRHSDLDVAQRAAQRECRGAILQARPGQHGIVEVLRTPDLALGHVLLGLAACLGEVERGSREPNAACRKRLGDGPPVCHGPSSGGSAGLEDPARLLRRPGPR